VEAGDLKAARAALKNGAGLDNHCARLSLVLAEVEFAANRFKEVCKQLRKACELEAALAPECMPLYRRACRELGNEAGYVEFLEDCLKTAPSLDVVRALKDHYQLSLGEAAAEAFVMAELQRNPSLGGFVTLLEQVAARGGPLDTVQREMVLGFFRTLLSRQPVYRCRHCGFSCKSLMWQCPSCRNWGVLKPVASELAEKN
jgi:lipopolysaccharide biosynthesis regulator YciM